MIIRPYKSLNVKLMKVLVDIKFIKLCKKENLKTTFESEFTYKKQQ